MPSLHSRLPILLLAFLSISSTMRAQQPDEYTRQAAQLIEDHRFPAALSILRKGIERYPESVEILLQLGGLLVHTGQVSEGEMILERAILLDPLNSGILSNSAEARLRQGKFQAAVELFKKALQQKAEDGEIRHRLAYTLFLQGEDKAALEEAKLSIQSSPLSPKYRRLLALLHEVLGEQEESYRQLRLAYRLDPSDAQTLYRLSRLERSRGRLHQAVEYAELAAQADPDSPIYPAETADIYREAGEDELARQAASEASALESAFDSYLKALRLVGRGYLIEAAAVLESATASRPGFTTGLILLADLQRRLNHPEKALKTYLEILEINPSLAVARQQRAWLRFQQGSLDSALEMLNESAAGRIDLLLLEGYQFLNAEDWQSALAKFREVETVSPLAPELLHLISFCLGKLADSKGALEYLAKAEQLQPGDAQVQTSRDQLQLEKAYRLVQANKWAPALDAINGLSSAASSEPEAILNKAYCYQQLGQLEKAAATYELGLQKDPAADWALSNLATVQYRLGRYQKAASSWETILRRKPDPQAYLQLGLCYSHLGRDPEAESVLRKALDLDSQAAEISYNLGITQLRLMKLEEAWEQIRKAAQAGYLPARQLLSRARLARR